VNKLNYALLIQDQTEEDQLNYALRKCDANVKTYRSLNELWSSLFTDTPNAIFADIRLFNNEEKFLKDHPLIINNTVSLILFYRDSDGPIVKNLPDSLFFDFVKLSSVYDLTCRRIHFRLKKFIQLELEKNELAQKIDAKDREFNNFQQKYFKLKSDEAMKTVGYLFVKRFFHQFRMTKNYLSSLAQTLEDFSFIQDYLMFEVEKEKQRIKTLNLSDKSRAIPSILIEENLTAAYFKNYTLKTCESIAADIFGRHSITLTLESSPGKIKYILSLKVNASYFDHVDKEFLSRILSGELQRFYAPEYISNIVKPIYELMPREDRIQKNIEHRNCLYEISLKSLKQEITAFNDFRWKNFFDDLIIGINQSMNGKGEIYVNGIDGLFIVIDYSFEIKELMYFLNQFMTWSYFEVEESSIGKMVDLGIRQLNLKTENLEQILGIEGRNSSVIDRKSFQEMIDVI